MLEMTRTAVRAVQCPACEAPAGERCVRARGRPREANHGERVEVAAAERKRAGSGGRDWDAGMTCDDRDWNEGMTTADGRTVATDTDVPSAAPDGSCPYKLDGFECDGRWLECLETNTAVACRCARAQAFARGAG